MPPAHLKAPPVEIERKPGRSGKMGFLSARDARHSIAKRALSGGSIYECKHCRFWHYSTWSTRHRP